MDGLPIALEAGPRAVARGDTPARDHAVFQTLNGIRGVAAVAVVLYHMHAAFGMPLLAPDGYVAVDLFFVLSGFVIANAYGDKIGTAMSARDFIVVRLIRLYPLYFVGLVVGAIKSLGHNVAGDGDALSPGTLAMMLGLGVLLLPAPSPVTAALFPFNVPGWSLFFETAINLTWLIALRRLSLPLVVLLVIVTGAIFLALIPAHGLVSLGIYWPRLLDGIPRTAFSFCVGLVLQRLGQRLPRRSGGIWPWLILMALAVLLLAPVPARLSTAFDIGFVFILSPTLVAFGARIEPSPASRGVFDFLGRISFPLYAVHYPLIGAWALIAAKAQMSPLVGGIAFIVGMVAVAAVLDRLDAAVRRRLTRFYGHWLRRTAR